MFKKISALFLAAVMLLGAVPVQARLSITDADEQLAVLKALGVASEMPYSVSEGDFVGYMAGLMYDEINGDTADFARMMGMIGSGEEFEATKRMSYGKALKYAVIALGYIIQAEASGYTQTAASLDLTDNIAMNEDSVLTGSAACQLLINMLEVEPLRQGFEGGEPVYRKATGETILSLNRGIVTIEGIVTANSVTGLTAVAGVGEGNIAIDGIVYDSLSGFDGLLGKSVYGFLKKDSLKDDQIIFLYEKKSKENVLQISAEQLVDLNAGQIRYKTDKDKTNTKRVRLSDTLRVIYNGVFCGDYTDADLLPDNGNLMLIDNDNDSIYDVAMITSYQTMVVAGAISDKEKLVNAYRFGTAADTVTLDLEDEDHKVKIYGEDGNEIKFDDISVNDVLSVAESRTNSPKVISVYKSSKVVEGIATDFDDNEKILTVGDTAYPYLDELILDNTQEGKPLKLGNKYNFYLDYFGNIVYMKYINEMDYYVFYKVLDMDGTYSVSYMDINENWLIAPMARRVAISEDARLSQEVAYQNLSFYQPQVVKMFFNSKGEVIEIQFAQASSQADENKFTKKTVTNAAYRDTPKCFESKIWLEDGAMMFVLPSNLKDKTGYSVQNAAGAFIGDTEYTVTSYDFDDFGFTNLISTSDADNAKILKNALFLVTKVKTVYVDGEVSSCVKGVCGDFMVYQLIGEDENTFSGVSVGDVIRVHTNRDGRVDSVSTPITTDAQRFVKKRSHLNNTGVYNRGDITTGVVTKIDVAAERIMIDAGEEVIFRLPSSIVVTIYNRSEKTSRRGTVADLTVGDRLICRTGYLQLQEIIVARD